MSFVCEKCGKEFAYNSLFNKHLNKKIPCDKITTLDKHTSAELLKIYNSHVHKIKQKINKSNNKQCYFCYNTYATKVTLKTHLNKSCKEKKKLETEKEKIKSKYDTIKLKELLNKTKKNNKNNKNIINNTQNITNNITNITNNLTLQLQVKTFGKEDLSHITLEDYKKCLEKRFPGLFEYIKLVHFNKNAPQNHNILLTNERSKFIKVYREGKFKREYKDEIIEDILNNNMFRLEEKAEELKNSVGNRIIKEHNEFKKIYYKNDKNIIKRNMETVENMILDDKEMIEKTHNDIKQITE